MMISDDIFFVRVIGVMRNQMKEVIKKCWCYVGWLVGWSHVGVSNMGVPEQTTGNCISVHQICFRLQVYIIQDCVFFFFDN